MEREEPLGETLVEEETRNAETHQRSLEGSPPRKMRRADDSRNATVETSDGIRMEVNSFELSRHSQFFRAFFYGDMARPGAKGIFKLNTVNSRMLRYCIEYIARMESIKPENTDLVTAVLVLETAAYLCLLRLERKLSQVICDLVDPVNLITIYAKIEDTSPDLARELWQRIVGDFEKLFENQTYLQLSEMEMMRLIQDENLDIQPKNEQKSVKDWCKSRSDCEKKDLTELAESLETLTNDPSIGSYITYKRRYPRSIILSLGGWSADGVCNAIEVYSTRTCSWKNAKPETRMTALSYHGCVNRKEGLYLLGGFNGHSYFNTNHHFDFKAQEWKTLAPMRYNRSYMSAVKLPQEDNALVALGGYTGAERLSTVEMYDIEKDLWTNLPSMNKARSDGSAVYIDDKCVAVGGFDGSVIHNNVEMFDFHRQKWDLVTPTMHSLRTGVCALALSRSVFGVFGGFNSQRRLKSVEFFDTREGVWHSLNDMITTRSNFTVELYDNKIVAAGGYDGARTTAEVESYDIRMNRWTAMPSMIVPKSALKITRVDDLDVIRTFSYPY